MHPTEQAARRRFKARFSESHNVIIPDGFKIADEFSFILDCWWLSLDGYWTPLENGSVESAKLVTIVIEKITDTKLGTLTIRYTIADLVSDCLALDHELYELRDSLKLLGECGKAALQTRIDHILEIKHEILSITLDKPEQFRKV